MRSNPLVTIVTPTYNSATTITDTLQSVSDQSYPNIEHLVVDGCSSDGTQEIVRRFVSSAQLRLVEEPDDGIYDAMNKGIARSDGEIVGILNSDDFLLDSDVIRRVVDRFISDDSSIVYCNVQLVAGDDPSRVVREWIPGLFREGSFARGWHPPHPGVFLSRGLYDKHGLFRTDYRIAADFELLLRLFETTGSTISYLPITAVRMRLGGASTGSLRSIIQGNRECLRAFRDNGMRVPPSYPVLRLVPKIRQFFRMTSE